MANWFTYAPRQHKFHSLHIELLEVKDGRLSDPKVAIAAVNISLDDTELSVRGGYNCYLFIA